MVTVEGRYPHSASPLRSKNISCEIINVSEFGAILRLDDVRNPDMWLNIHMEREDVVDIIRQMDEAVKTDELVGSAYGGA